MLTINVERGEGGKVISAKVVDYDYKTRAPDTYENRNHWKSFETVTEIAAALGEGYVPMDAGPYVSPRFDVIDVPKLGAAVSYTFNGDYYPCGTVKSISAGPDFRRIVAGPDFSGKDRVFWRRCRDGKPVGGAWVNNKTWSLIPGTHDRRNPEF